MTMFVAFVLTVSAACAAFGQILFKMGATNATSLFDVINLKIAAGLFFYALGMMLWLVGLSKAPLSLVYPFTFLTFIGVGLAGIYIFDESPTPITLIGWATIIIGLTVVQIGAR